MRFCLDSFERSEIAAVAKETPDQAALKELQKLLPTGELLGTSDYDTLLGGDLAAFEGRFQGSPHLAEVKKIIADTPVVMFALEWCEFCWSVRRMFAEAGIEYVSVDLDSVAYQEGDKGGRYRAALREITGLPTIPQIFVGGEHIGGATETFDAFNDGSLKEAMSASEVKFDPAMTRDAYSFLPKWLHSR